MYAVNHGTHLQGHVMNLYLHDANEHDPVTGTMRAPTHCGTIRNIDYEYQVEQWLLDLAAEHANVAKVESSDGRWWERAADGFKSIRCPVDQDSAHV